jgi:hypothetical protein
MNREPIPDTRRPDFGMGDPVIRESKHNMVEYLTEVTRDMKRIMDEHTILMKQLLTVLTSIRDAQQQDRWNNQGRGR